MFDYTETRETAVDMLEDLKGKEIATVTVTQKKEKEYLHVVMVLSEVPIIEVEILSPMVSVDGTPAEELLKGNEYDSLNERTWGEEGIALSDYSKENKDEEGYDLWLLFET